MKLEDILKTDLSMPPIMVTAKDRSEFMLKCTETKRNIFAQLKQVVTTDSLEHCGSFVGMCQKIAVRLQVAMEKMFQIPHNLFTRADFKMLVAWGVFNAYVKSYATKHDKLKTRDWTEDMEKASTETIHDVVKSMYEMATANSMLSR